jgi:hypothetical protein
MYMCISNSLRWHQYVFLYGRIMTIADNIKTNEHINGVTQNTATWTRCQIPLFFIMLSGVRVTRSLVLCVCFVDRCLYFFLGHCGVCSSSIYGLCLHLWYLQALLHEQLQYDFSRKNVQYLFLEQCCWNVRSQAQKDLKYFYMIFLFCDLRF